MVPTKTRRGKNANIDHSFICLGDLKIEPEAPDAKASVVQQILSEAAAFCGRTGGHVTNRELMVA
ncbi:hypothetical protein D3C87_1955900 [compost metagenome]